MFKNLRFCHLDKTTFVGGNHNIQADRYDAAVNYIK